MCCLSLRFTSLFRNTVHYVRFQKEFSVSVQKRRPLRSSVWEWKSVEAESAAFNGGLYSPASKVS